MPSLEIITTQAGDELLAGDNPDIQAVVDAFDQTLDRAPESVVLEAIQNRGGFYLGGGRFSHVMRLGEYAFKVSSASSTASENHPDVGSFAENTANQLTYLDALHAYLETQPEARLTTPQQYFAMRSARHGGCLAVQQFMDGWVSLGSWTDRAYRFIDDDAAEAEVKAMTIVLRDRIHRAVEGTDLLKGLNDLRLDEEAIHPANLLVPRYHEYDPKTVPVCIIDQPKSYIRPSGETFIPKPSA